jgi:hypothetical protein
MEVETALRQEFKSLAFARAEFPMLTSWNVEDFSETIHSLGMNYLSAFGRHCNRWAASEYPIRVARADGSPSHVRLDTVWWARPTRAVELLGEFERYDQQMGKQFVLAAKVRNLLLAHHHLGPGSRVLLLLIWTLSGRTPQRLTELSNLARTGYRTSDGLSIPGLDAESRLIVATAVFAASKGLLRLQEILL